MRATNHKHYAKEQQAKRTAKPGAKKRRAVKASSICFAAVIVAAAFIVPTTTLAPGVEAYADSRIASYSVGDIDKFSTVIKGNCVEVTTTPETEAVVTAAETKPEETTVEATTAAPVETKPAATTKAKTEEVPETKPVETAAPEEKHSEAQTSASNKEPGESATPAKAANVPYSGATLVDIANPDYSYSPSYVSLSDYDRAKLERLVMGEAGTMGYTGCALVAQSIRDAMNRSNTSSIDQIISEYQYFGSTSVEPNQDVLDAVSFIFDQNGSAVQHRVLCFYIGYSAWHETQNFITSIGGVRFFDLIF